MKGEFLGKICPFMRFIVVGFALNTVYLGGALLILLISEPGTDSHIVALAVVGIATMGFAVISPLIYLCHNYTVSLVSG